MHSVPLMNLGSALCVDIQVLTAFKTDCNIFPFFFKQPVVTAKKQTTTGS